MQIQAQDSEHHYHQTYSKEGPDAPIALAIVLGLQSSYKSTEQNPHRDGANNQTDNPKPETQPQSQPSPQTQPKQRNPSKHCRTPRNPPTTILRTDPIMTTLWRRFSNPSIEEGKQFVYSHFDGLPPFWDLRDFYSGSNKNAENETTLIVKVNGYLYGKFKSGASGFDINPRSPLKASTYTLDSHVEEQALHSIDHNWTRMMGLGVLSPTNNTITLMMTKGPCWYSAKELKTVNTNGGTKKKVVQVKNSKGKPKPADEIIVDKVVPENLPDTENTTPGFNAERNNRSHSRCLRLLLEWAKARKVGLRLKIPGAHYKSIDNATELAKHGFTVKSFVNFLDSVQNRNGLSKNIRHEFGATVMNANFFLMRDPSFIKAMSARKEPTLDKDLAERFTERFKAFGQFVQQGTDPDVVYKKYPDNISRKYKTAELFNPTSMPIVPQDAAEDVPLGSLSVVSYEPTGKTGEGIGTKRGSALALDPQFRDIKKILTNKKQQE